MDVKIQPQTRNNILFLSNLALLALSGSRIFPYTINKMYKPAPIEKRLNNIVGVVTNGLFANRSADILLLGSESGVKTIVSD